MKNSIRHLLSGLLALALPLGAINAFAQDSEPPKKEEAKSDDGKAPKSVSEVPADKKIIYRIDLTGAFGHDVTRTPVKQILEDAKKWNPDYLVFYVDMAYVGWGERLDDHDMSPRNTGFAFNQLETAREIQTLFTDGIRDNPDWKTREGKKPELIMWVRKAMGGAAFLPFVAPKIFYTSDGKQGGIGYLEYIFQGRGDYDARQKQYSLRMGRAEGLAVKGGHEPKLVKAMCYMWYVLSVSYVGGKPVFFEDDTGDELLTDDGNEDAGRRDTYDDVLRGNGNDCLNLDAPKAFKLGLSAGTIDSNDDLADELGVARNYVIVKGKAGDAIQKWSKQVSQAERDMQAKFREFERTPIEGATAAERNRGRAKQLKLLNQILELYNKYDEAIDQRSIRVPSKEDIEIAIEQIKQQIRQDR